MSKKIVAMLMAVAMAFSLLPVTAFAVGEENGQAPVTKKASENNLTMNKTVTPEGDGTYTVRLESYATGSVTTTQAPVPMDFVLVLDVSGSMTDEIASYTYQATNKTSWSVSDVYNDYYQKDKLGIPHRTDVTYYAKIDDEYYPVFYKQKRVRQGVFKGYYEYWLEANNKPLGPRVTDSTWKKEVYNEALYIRKTDSKEKLEAMKTAVNHFIDSVAAQRNGETPVAHRISIVKFAGDPSDKVSNDTYKENRHTYNYTQKVRELTDVTAAGSVDSLKNAVNDLTAGGATRADLGMEKADGVLNGRQDAEKNRPSVVIMFTDGEPTTSNDFEWKVAGAAVDTAKTLKAGGTKVYTIGMFEDADPGDIDGAFNKYMNGVSSKYPDAVGTKKNNKKDYNGIYLGTPAGGNYYFKADNAGDLDKVFQTISESTTVTSPLDASAVVVDKVPSNFEAPISKDNVTLKVAGYKADGTFGTETAAPSTIHASVNEDGTVSVTGFNFSENWCGLDGTTPNGKKLIIEFTIKCTNYGGTQPTNDGAYIKAKADDANPIIKLDYPTVPVKVKLPDGSDPYTDTKVYDGAGFDIKNEIGKIVANLVPVDGIKNQFIDLTYEIKDSSGKKVGTYTIPAGETTGTWNSNEEIKTGSDADTYNYTITVTGQDKKQTSNNDSKECTATFTIKERDVTFTGKSDSLTWTGDEQTITDITAPTDLVPGHTYEGGLNYVAKGTDTGSYDGVFTGTAIIKDAAGIDVTANYNVKTKPGKLTIIDSIREVTVTFNVVGGTWSDGETKHSAKVTLTNGKGSLNGADIPTGSPSDGHTGPGVWKNDANITGDPVNGMEITKDTVFTLTYSKIEPVITNVDVTFKIVGGKWSDGKTEDIKRVVKLTNGTGSLAGVEIPTGVADAEHQGNGTWTPVTPEAGTEITQDGNKVFTLTFQKKEEQKPSDPVKLDVSCSKIAFDDLTKNSNGDWTTDVTLSLPSAEYKPVIDVVFILDDSHAGNEIFKDAATSLLTELSQKENVDVNVGIVNFDAVARDWVAATTNSQYSGLISVKNAEGLQALNTAIATKLVYEKDGQTKKVGATNIEWPLEMAQNMLASGKGTEKYAILFSDMYGYVYRGDLIIDGQTYKNVPLSKRLYAGESKFYQGSLSMGTKYQSFADVYAHRNDEENQTTDGFFRDSSWNSYWSIYSGHTQIPINPATKDSVDPFGVPGGYSGFEKSTCLVYDRLLQMKQAGINISIVNNDFAPGDIREVGHVQSIKNNMLDTLKQKGISVIKTQKNVTAEDMTNVFDTLKDQLIQVVSAGSTVTDKIGTNFDFVGLNTMSLKIGDNTIPRVIDEATNTITFKHGGKNNAHVVVYDSSADSFTWTINEDVTKDARVQLTYSVKLTKPETAAGTYGVTDLNGDGKVDGTDTTYTDTDALYTNESATMVPKDSDGNTGEKLTFHKPSVSYTVSSGNSGSHSGGSRPSLNTKDHYGYIIGYPVDYYTGQPTTDQTKKPVRPEGKITRAEVATIYFRMLTDESRTKFWSQSSGYSDVKAGDWFNNAVSTLSKAGIIAGYEDGSFRPNGYITRAEFATIAARFFDVTYNGKDLFPDISGHWAKDYINQAANKGFVNGYEDGTFKPDRNITRAEAVTLVNRTLDRHPDKNHFTKDMLVWPDNMDQTKWYYADMQEATNSHTYQMKENSDKTKYENWTKTLPIRNWEALEKAWSNANSSQGNGNVV